jgi:hypothetical protein
MRFYYIHIHIYYVHVHIRIVHLSANLMIAISSRLEKTSNIISRPIILRTRYESGTAHIQGIQGLS